MTHTNLDTARNVHVDAITKETSRYTPTSSAENQKAPEHGRNTWSKTTKLTMRTSQVIYNSKQ